MASHYSIQDCFQTIYSTCNNATFVADRLAYGDHCSNVSLFWDAPLYNMTILFDSHFLKPYEICIQPVACVKAFYTDDDEHEVPIDWGRSSQKPVCFGTQRADRPIMKFRFDAGDYWHCYGTFIRFFYHM